MLPVFVTWMDLSATTWILLALVTSPPYPLPTTTFSQLITTFWVALIRCILRTAEIRYFPFKKIMFGTCPSVASISYLKFLSGTVDRWKVIGPRNLQPSLHPLKKNKPKTCQKRLERLNDKGKYPYKKRGNSISCSLCYNRT